MTSSDSSLNSSSPLTFSPHANNMFFAVSILRVVLLLPLSAWVLRLAFLRWRPRHSLQSATHSDILTYNLAAIELLWVLSYASELCGVYLDVYALRVLGGWTIIAFYAEILSNMLSCLDWHLAVLHPVAYMRLRSARGALIRSAVVCALWLLCFALMGYFCVWMPRDQLQLAQVAALLSLLSVSIAITLFCSSSVVCALAGARPGVGGSRSGRPAVGQSKRRALVTVVAIAAVQSLWFLGLLVSQVINKVEVLDSGRSDVLAAAMGFLNLPSSSVTPVLFLHRAGQLSCTWRQCE